MLLKETITNVQFRLPEDKVANERRSEAYSRIIKAQRVVNLAASKGVKPDELNEEDLDKLLIDWAANVDTSGASHSTYELGNLILDCGMAGISLDSCFLTLTTYYASEMFTPDLIRNIDKSELSNLFEYLMDYYTNRFLLYDIDLDEHQLDKLLMFYVNAHYDCLSADVAWLHFEGAWVEAIFTFALFKKVDEDHIMDIVIRSVQWPYYAETAEHYEKRSYHNVDLMHKQFYEQLSSKMKEYQPTWVRR
jgi:hypothetical protein